MNCIHLATNLTKRFGLIHGQKVIKISSNKNNKHNVYAAKYSCIVINCNELFIALFQTKIIISYIYTRTSKTCERNCLEILKIDTFIALNWCNKLFTRHVRN